MLLRCIFFPSEKGVEDRTVWARNFQQSTTGEQLFVDQPSVVRETPLSAPLKSDAPFINASSVEGSSSDVQVEVVGDAAGPLPDRLIYVTILSAPKNHEKRNVLRKAFVTDVKSRYPTGTVRAKFIIGHGKFPGSGQGTLVDKNGFELERSLREEEVKHGDVVRIPLPEAYEHLPDKTLLTVDHFVSSRYCFMVKLDDDQIFRPRSSVRFFQKRDPMSLLYMGGYIHDVFSYKAMAGKDGQFNKYFAGPSYILSWELARRVVRVHRDYSSQFLFYGSSSEDVDMGKWVRHVEENSNGTKVKFLEDGFYTEALSTWKAPEVRNRESFADYGKRSLDWRSGRKVGPVAGGGSHPDGCRPFVKFLTKWFVKHPDVTSVVEASAGHWPTGWQTKVAWPPLNLTAIDVREELIEDNKAFFNTPEGRAVGLKEVDFRVADMFKGQLPEADLLLTKETLMLYPNEEIEDFLKANVLACPRRFKYVMFVHDQEDPAGNNVKENNRLTSGVNEFHCLHMGGKPFSLPVKTVLTYDLGRRKAVELMEVPEC